MKKIEIKEPQHIVADRAWFEKNIRLFESLGYPLALDKGNKYGICQDDYDNDEKIKKPPTGAKK